MLKCLSWIPVTEFQFGLSFLIEMLKPYFSEIDFIFNCFLEKQIQHRFQDLMLSTYKP